MVYHMQIPIAFMGFLNQRSHHWGGPYIDVILSGNEIMKPWWPHRIISGTKNLWSNPPCRNPTIYLAFGLTDWHMNTYDRLGFCNWCGWSMVIKWLLLQAMLHRSFWASNSHTSQDIQGLSDPERRTFGTSGQGTTNVYHQRRSYFSGAKD